MLYRPCLFRLEGDRPGRARGRVDSSLSSFDLRLLPFDDENSTSRIHFSPNKKRDFFYSNRLLTARLLSNLASSSPSRGALGQPQEMLQTANYPFSQRSGLSHPLWSLIQISSNQPLELHPPFVVSQPQPRPSRVDALYTPPTSLSRT